ncbi:fibronectin type III domain-containing protein [Rhodohalobacter sp.]|uniref:glycoside hydrolase family 78 protein n=1 Tax=Rhodohalobacter sp. TaxID=1974210 RepID=UPI002ACDBAF1|nr:T9SS type A sorting domain-containing protein [Rhodohalobacter sp.]MDZ7755195.1 T9SS type A sorting domain-containing protein [Rhodohalobacter sp.]
MKEQFQTLGRKLFTPSLRDENPNRTFQLLRLNGNDLQGVIPDWFTAANGVTAHLGGNRWTHKDVLENDVSISDSEEYGLKPFGFAEEIIVADGEAYTADYSHKIHSTDRIQWTKDGSPISGGGNGILTINNISQSDEGVYRLELTNPNSGLPATVVSEPIELRIGEPGEDSGNPPATPTLLSPSNGSSGVSTSPNLDWNSVSNVSSYRLQVAEDSGFSNIVKNDNGLTQSQQSVSGLDYETTYYWRVRAVNSDGASDWSPVWSFTTESNGNDDGGSGSDSPPAAPTLSSPSNGSSGVSTSPDLSWNSVSNAASYRLQVSETSGFASTVVNDNGITSIQRQVSSLDYETTYYWRVRAVNSDGASDWSSTRSFTTESNGNDDGGSGSGGGSGGGDDSPAQGAPGLKSPSDQSNNVSLTPEFEWSVVENADYYILHVNSVNPAEMVINEEVSGTSFTVNQSLDPETVYHWRVRAVVNGEEGDWSPIGEFTTRSEDENEETAFEVELSQNYPNPFNPSTNIRFSIAEQQEVSLKVYDMAGRLVASLIDSNTLSAGTHSASFNAERLASGIDFYRLITPSEIVTRKMTLMKQYVPL